MATPLPSSLDSLLRLYDGLEKIDPKDLKKLEDAQETEKSKILENIAKKILVTEKKDTNDSSKVKIKAKPFAWGFVHFIRKILGISTIQKTNLETALSQIRKSFQEAPTSCTPEQAAKLDRLKEIINAVIVKTGSGECIGSQPRNVTLPQNRTAVLGGIGDKTIASTQGEHKVSTEGKQPVEHPVAWYTEFEASFHQEFKQIFSDISYEQFLGTLKELGNTYNWKHAKGIEGSTPELFAHLEKLFKVDSRMKVTDKEHMGIKMCSNAELIKLFEKIKDPLPLTPNMLKAHDATGAIEQQKKSIQLLGELVKTITNHPDWESAVDKFAKAQQARQALGAELEQRKQFITAFANTQKSPLSIPAVQTALAMFKQGRLNDSDVSALFEICTFLNTNGPRLQEQLKKLEARQPAPISGPNTFGEAPPPPPPPDADTASVKKPLSEILPTLPDYIEASQLLGIRSLQSLKDLHSALSQVDSMLHKAESLHSILDRITAIPAQIQTLQERSASLSIDKDFSLDKFLPGSAPLTTHIREMSVPFTSFSTAEAPKSLKALDEMLQTKEQELEVLNQGVQCITKLKETLKPFWGNISHQAKMETTTLLPLVMKAVNWDNIEKPIANTKAGHAVKHAAETKGASPYYQQLTDEFKAKKDDPVAKLLINIQRQLNKETLTPSQFGIDEHAKLFTLATNSLTAMVSRYGKINQQIEVWEKASPPASKETIQHELANWCKEKLDIKAPLNSLSESINALTEKTKEYSELRTTLQALQQQVAKAKPNKREQEVFNQLFGQSRLLSIEPFLQQDFTKEMVATEKALIAKITQQLTQIERPDKSKPKIAAGRKPNATAKESTEITQAKQRLNSLLENITAVNSDDLFWGSDIEELYQKVLSSLVEFSISNLSDKQKLAKEIQELLNQCKSNKDSNIKEATEALKTHLESLQAELAKL